MFVFFNYHNASTLVSDQEVAERTEMHQSSEAIIVNTIYNAAKLEFNENIKWR